MLVKRWKVTKKYNKWCEQTKRLLATLLWGYTLKVLVTSYQLPWQRTRATKTSTKFQFLLIIWKTNSVSYHFYFFVGKFPKFFNFSDSMEKIYLVELNIFKENAIYGLQEDLLHTFLPNPNPNLRVTLHKFLSKTLEVTLKNHAFTPKTKVGDLKKNVTHPANFFPEVFLVSVGVNCPKGSFLFSTVGWFRSNKHSRHLKQGEFTGFSIL